MSKKGVKEASFEKLTSSFKEELGVKPTKKIKTKPSFLLPPDRLEKKQEFFLESQKFLSRLKAKRGKTREAAFEAQKRLERERAALEKLGGRELPKPGSLEVKIPKGSSITGEIVNQVETLTGRRLKPEEVRSLFYEAILPDNPNLKPPGKEGVVRGRWSPQTGWDLVRPGQEFSFSLGVKTRKWFEDHNISFPTTKAERPKKEKPKRPSQLREKLETRVSKKKKKRPIEPGLRAAPEARESAKEPATRELVAEKTEERKESAPEAELKRWRELRKKKEEEKPEQIKKETPEAPPEEVERKEPTKLRKRPSLEEAKEVEIPKKPLEKPEKKEVQPPAKQGLKPSPEIQPSREKAQPPLPEKEAFKYDKKSIRAVVTGTRINSLEDLEKTPYFQNAPDKQTKEKIKQEAVRYQQRFFGPTSLTYIPPENRISWEEINWQALDKKYGSFKGLPLNKFLDKYGHQLTQELVLKWAFENNRIKKEHFESFEKLGRTGNYSLVAKELPRNSKPERWLREVGKVKKPEQLAHVMRSMEWGNWRRIANAIEWASPVPLPLESGTALVQEKNSKATRRFAIDTVVQTAIFGAGMIAGGIVGSIVAPGPGTAAGAAAGGALARYLSRIGAKIGARLARRGAAEAAEKVVAKAGAELAEKAVQETGEKIVKEAVEAVAQKTTRQAIKVTAKTVGGEVAEKAEKEVGERVVREAAKTAVGKTEKKGFFQRIFDSVGGFFRRLFGRKTEAGPKAFKQFEASLATRVGSKGGVLEKEVLVKMPGLTEPIRVPTKMLAKTTEAQTKFSRFYDDVLRTVLADRAAARGIKVESLNTAGLRQLMVEEFQTLPSETQKALTQFTAMQVIGQEGVEDLLSKAGGRGVKDFTQEAGKIIKATKAQREAEEKALKKAAKKRTQTGAAEALVKGKKARLIDKIKIGAKTDVGRVRPHNEDFFAHPLWAMSAYGISPAAVEKRGALYVVADGMGGAQAGEVASREATGRLYKAYYHSPGFSNPETVLRGAFDKANQEVYYLAQKPEHYGMGTTLTAGVIKDGELIIGHVGDSRAYLVRGKEIIQLTRDHTLVEEMVRRGTITRAEAKTHPQGNILEKAIGTNPYERADIIRQRLQKGDKIILTTDGLTGLVNETEIWRLVSRLKPQEATEQLIRLANQKGGRDNITALVVEFGG